jgi:pyruvate dehydrogenase E2 component (dihydrolipoamide acetyltransferase)
MAEFRMPSLGADMEGATLTTWMVRPGDTVKHGAVVAAVETAKGIIDIEIFEDGVIETLLAEPGAYVAVGGSLATYRSLSPGAVPQAATAVIAEPAPAATAKSALGPSSAAERPPMAAPAAVEAARAAAERRLVSPAARRRAAELKIDLAAVRASGTGGAVTLQDVERAAASATSAPPDMRTLIAQSMSRAKREIPHYYLATTIDMTAARRFLDTWNASHGVAERMLDGVLLLKAVARALEKTPELNGFWRDGRFEPSAAINVGVAIRLRQGGLVAPALQDTNREPLAALMRRFQDLVGRARAGRLHRAELTDATITVSSLGEGGVETLYPIIYPPQVAIVGFGGILLRPWCADGTIRAAPLITATLSADHRVSDGHRGSVFLAEVARLLQRPEEL